MTPCPLSSFNLTVESRIERAEMTKPRVKILASVVHMHHGLAKLMDEGLHSNEARMRVVAMESDKGNPDLVVLNQRHSDNTDTFD